ncbi:hypothetical protein [Peribacillus simplex]|uniref:hypothetical protein n=1 Tax=Peribacillus simplex TaxID=1478 RepID=UPI0024C1BD61|nr:hypothetical protein [Peribacillus simplex]WHY54523.1 hypothetical protein QNH43_15145 [Peribacillus simplex]
MPKKEIQVVQSYLNKEDSQLATAKKFGLISTGFGAEILKYKRLFRLKGNTAR